MKTSASRNIPTLLQLTKLSAFVGVAAIIVLSLLPGDERPHTGAGGGPEHFVAYALVGLAFGIGYGSRRQQMLAGAALAILSGCLEVAQIFIPGRTAEFAGWFSSSAGAWAGLCAAAAVAARLRQRRR